MERTAKSYRHARETRIAAQLEFPRRSKRFNLLIACLRKTAFNRPCRSGGSHRSFLLPGGLPLLFFQIAFRRPQVLHRESTGGHANELGNFLIPSVAGRKIADGFISPVLP